MTAAARYRAACARLGLPVWRPGMLALRHAPGYRDDGRPEVRVRGAADAEAAEGSVPDFTDPATVGCLLAAVREAWACPTLSVVWCFVPHPGGDWFVPRIPADAHGETEAEALIAALEAAAAAPARPRGAPSAAWPRPTASPSPPRCPM